MAYTDAILVGYFKMELLFHPLDTIFNLKHFTIFFCSFESRRCDKNFPTGKECYSLFCVKIEIIFFIIARFHRHIIYSITSSLSPGTDAERPSNMKLIKITKIDRLCSCCNIHNSYIVKPNMPGIRFYFYTNSTCFQLASLTLCN